MCSNSFMIVDQQTARVIGPFSCMTDVELWVETVCAPWPGGHGSTDDFRIEEVQSPDSAAQNITGREWSELVRTALPVPTL